MVPMPNDIAIRWTVPVSPETDRAVRAHLEARGMNAAELARFVEEAVQRRLLDESVAEARKGFADLAPEEVERLVEEAVASVREDARRAR
jgi:hypothetical protein